MKTKDMVWLGCAIYQFLWIVSTDMEIEITFNGKWDVNLKDSLGLFASRADFILW